MLFVYICVCVCPSVYVFYLLGREIPLDNIITNHNSESASSVFTIEDGIVEKSVSTKFKRIFLSKQIFYELFIVCVLVMHLLFCYYV